MKKIATLKLSFEKRELAILAALLFLAFMVRFAFFSNQGYQIDTTDFMLWFQHAADVGPRAFYSNNYWCDYPPFNVFFFWSFGLLAKSLAVFNTNMFVYVMKVPPNLFEMATTFVIFAFIRKRLSFKWALAGATLYVFNPAVIFNAAVWGQFDAIYTFFLVSSLFLVFESKTKLGIVAFMLGILTKPQSIAIAPLFIYLVLRKSDWKGFLTSLGAAAATFVGVILPFEWTNGNPVTWLSNIYFGAYSGYQYTTLNAFNIWGFGGMWVPDTGGLNVIGWILFGAMAAFTVYFVHKRHDVSDELIVIFAAFVLFFSFFMLPTRIHERYLFPAISMLVLMFPFLKKTRLLYVALTITCFVNQAYVLNALVTAYPNAANLSGDPVSLIVSLINSIAFLYVLMLMIEELWGRKWLSRIDLKHESTLQEKEDNQRCN
jgi:dolichyl-phosphate-mannose-protein mannosyltransferase